jgi:hypothetical protein
MPGALGLSLLVLTVAVGLTQLAVRRPVEHLAGMVVAIGLAFTLLLAAPAAGVLLLVLAFWTRRLTTAPVVPDRLPSHWA